MHIEILVEDSSGLRLLEHLMPKLVGPLGSSNTWRVHSYKGIGRIPPNLSARSDPAKRILLDQLPKLLRGYARTPGIDAIVVVLDSDNRDCKQFLGELQSVARKCDATPNTLFRLAIEEMEAWYLGDQPALMRAFPRAKRAIIERYAQDSICGTWELLADAVHTGGVRAVRKAGWPLPGELKHVWADRIGPHMDPDRNISPSFGKLRDGLRRLTSPAA